MPADLDLDFDLDLNLDVGTERSSVMGSITNELVKSYGFRLENGKWSWSLENIGKSFQEDPFWTTLDYLTLGAAPLKAGFTAAKVARAGGAVGKAFRAGEFAGKVAKTRMGQFVEDVAGKPGLGAAMELYQKGPVQGPSVFGKDVGRFFQSPQSIELSDEYMGLVERYGAEPFEQRGIVKVLQNEREIERAASNREASDMLKAFDAAPIGKDPAKMQAAYRAFSAGEKADSPAVQAIMGTDLASAKANAAFRQYAEDTHNMLYERGWISEETYAKYLGKNNPRAYAEFEELSKARGALGGAGKGAGWTQNMKEKADLALEGFEVTEDLRTSLVKLASVRAGMARADYAAKLGKSVIARDAEDVATLAREVIESKDLAKLHGIDPARVEGVRRIVNAADAIAVKSGAASNVADPAAVRAFKNTRDGQNIFHGSSSEVRLQEGHWATQNIYGQGFYTTDAIDVAAGYTKKGGGAAPSVYVVSPKAGALYDLDAPMSDSVKRYLTEHAERDGSGVAELALSENPASLREFYDAARGWSRGEGVSADEVQEGIFEPVSAFLKGEGFIGVRHVGGNNTKTAAHNVRIYFNPSEDVTLTAVDLERFRVPPPGSGKLSEASQRAVSVGADDVAGALGWRRMADLYADQPGILKHLERNGVDKKWIDPAAAPDIAEQLEFLKERFPLAEMYSKFVGYFSTSKTAYNPASYIRNSFGAFVHYNLKTGKFGTPAAALGEYRANGELFREFIQRGMGRAGISTATLDKLQDAADFRGVEKGYKASTGLDWLGDSKMAQILQSGAGKAEETYRAIDEVWNLQAWMDLRAGYMKGGKAAKEAGDLAMRDSFKFGPVHGMGSPFAEGLKQVVPFSSFTSEALRVWKNTMIEKPHYAYFWNHVTEVMSETFGAFAGMTPEDVAEAQSQLPEYAQGKKLVLLPFRVDGAPRFLDLSYMIPLGNLNDTEQTGNLFFSEFYDVTANPLLNFTAAAATGKDPFSGREIAPNFTERQLGVPVDGPRMRKLMGLAEHAAMTLLPPLAPPGYAGVNLLEAARGQLNPQTGEPLEASVLETIGANVAGLKLYRPSLESKAGNLMRATQETSDQLNQAWDRWGGARTNGDAAAMQREQERILTRMVESGKTADEAVEAFGKSAERRKPFSNLSTAQLKQLVDESAGRELSDKDRRVRGELMQRLQSRGNQ